MPLILHAQNHQNTAVREISDSAQQLFCSQKKLKLILLLQLLLLLSCEIQSQLPIIFEYFMQLLFFVRMRRAHHIVISCMGIKGRYSAKSAIFAPQQQLYGNRP